ncbi:hypothetical protein J6590_071750 [Homalodisca vitripennis]|nr:hypothetical protein J6590_071750 [Homalodisca vitripennis]
MEDTQAISRDSVFSVGTAGRSDEFPKLKAESQQIAVWQLLYRVQHPAWYQSHLQKIPSRDIEICD